MVNKKTSSKLIKLADGLIQEMEKRTDPFDSFAVVFPNLKIEQWFKTYWLQNKFEVLMNVDFMSINDALFRMIPHNAIKQAKTDTLKYLILKIVSDEDFRNKVLPVEIREYLTDEGKISDVRFYDFADKLSSLFSQYEKEATSLSGWQKELYEAVCDQCDGYGVKTIANMRKSDSGCRKIASRLCFFGFTEMDKLTEEMIEDYGKQFDVSLYLLKYDEEAEHQNHTFVSAPNRIKEIEFVHSEICRELLKGECQFSDFLVLAPDISKYETAIERVFEQDDINFPSIPYAINGKETVSTRVSEGIEKLIRIINKKGCTRRDFFELISNSDIQNIRGIDSDDVAQIMEAIVNMNVYRNNDSFDDWEYACRRLLLSKLVNINDEDNIVELGGERYVPYSDRYFDDEKIETFVEMATDLRSWQSAMKVIDTVTADNLEIIRVELNKWFSVTDDEGTETNKYYRGVLDVFNKWQEYGLTDCKIPVNVLFYCLLDASKTIEFSLGKYFSSGIAFASLDDDSVLSSKHVFILDCDSKNMPKPIARSELDLRPVVKDKTRDIFMLQHVNAEKHFYASYLNKDLKTDENYYPSPFIIELVKDKKKIKTLSIDETREYDELYTQREFNDKEYYLGLLSNVKKEDASGEGKCADRKIKVTIKDIADYLDEPLKYKASVLFSKGYDEYKDIYDEYEKTDVDNIRRATIVKKCALEMLKKKSTMLDASFFERMNIEHKLPYINTMLKKKAIDSIVEDCKSLYEIVDEKSKGVWEIVKPEDLSMETKQHENWVLLCDTEICRSKKDGQIMYFEIKKLANPKYANDISYYLFSYAYSLFDIATMDEREYEVRLIRGDDNYSYSITPEQAKECLNDIFEAMNDYSVNVYLSRTFFKKPCVSWKQIISDIDSPKGNGPWRYYEDKKMFDIERQIGYTENDFMNVYLENVSKHISLIKFIKVTE